MASDIKEDRDDAFGDGDILCRSCLHRVTSGREAIEKDGAHTHTFANPYGNVFEIGCFRNAPGCVHLGPTTSEFTWFKGYGWKLALCGACNGHLGWVYVASSGDAMFHGLILNRLTQTSSGKPSGFKH